MRLYDLFRESAADCDAPCVFVMRRPCSPASRCQFASLISYSTGGPASGFSAPVRYRFRRRARRARSAPLRRSRCSSARPNSSISRAISATRLSSASRAALNCGFGERSTCGFSFIIVTHRAHYRQFRQRASIVAALLSLLRTETRMTRESVHSNDATGVKSMTASMPRNDTERD